MGVLLFRINTRAVAYTWDGGGSDGTCGGGVGDGNKWSCAANWSSDIVPGASDTVTFNSTSTKNVTIDAGWAGTVGGITIASTYSGTITQARSLTVSGAFSQAAGTFTGSSDSITFNNSFSLTGGTFSGGSGSDSFSSGGSFSISAGTFNASSGTTTFGSFGFTHSGTATFNHNNGTVVFGGSSNNTYTSASTLTFYDVTFNNTGGLSWGLSSKTLTIIHNLTLTNGTVDNGTLDVGTNTAASRSVTQAAGFDGGSAVVQVSGTDVIALTLTGDSDSTTGFPGLTMNAANATFTMTGAASSTEEFEGAVTWTAGPTFAPDANVTTVGLESTLTLNGGTMNLGSATFTVTGAQTMSSGTFTGGTGAHTYTGATTISGATYSKTSGAVSHGGALNVSSGSYTSSSTSVSIAGSLTLSSTGAFTASSGTTTISGSAAAFSHTGSATFTHNSGSFVFSNGCTSCQVTYSTASTLSFYDVTYNATNGSYWNLSNNTLNVTHNLTLTDGMVNSGTISVGTNTGLSRTVTQAAGFDGGTAVVSVSGTDVFSLSLNADSDSTTGFPGLTMNAANATVTNNGSTGNQEFEGAVTITAGTFDCPTAGPGCQFESTLTVNGGTFNANGSALAVTGAGTFSSGTFNGGTGTHTYTGADTYSGVTYSKTSGNVTYTSTFTQSAGTYTATSGTTTFNAAYTHTAGGTFTHNSGSVKFTGSSYTVDVATSDTFNNLEIAMTGGQTMTVATGDTLYVVGNLTLTDGLLGTGSVEVTGNVSGTSTVTMTTTFDGSSSGGVVKATGSNTITGTLTSGSAPYLLLNNTNATFTGSGSGTITFTNGSGSNSYTVSAGTLNFGSLNVTTNSSLTATVSGGSVTTGSGTSTYNGNFSMSSGSFTLGGGATTFAGTYTQSGGTFTGGAGNVTYTNTFSQSAGTYTASSATTEHRTNVTFSGTAAFNHNNGTVKWNTASFTSYTYSSASTMTFYDFIIDGTNSGTWTLSSGTINVAHNLTVPGTGAIVVNSGTISMANTSGLSRTASQGVGSGGGTAILSIGGTDTIAVSYTSSATTTRCIGLTLNNPNATVTVNGTAGQVTSDAAFTLTSGTFTGPASGGKIIFGTGTTTLNGATVNGGAGTIQSNTAASLTSGTWNGGTGTLTFSSTFTLNGATFDGQTAAVTHTGNVTLTSGTYTATSGTTEFQGNITATSATFAHNNGTVKLNTQSFITYTYSASSPLTFYDLNVSGSNSGTWTLSSGTLNIAHNYLHSSSGTTIGTGTIAFTGAGNTQTMTLTGATGSLDASVTVNKSSGTVQLASALVLNAASQNLTVTSGTFALAGNALTVNGTSGTVTVGASGTFQLQGGESTTFNASNPTLSTGSTVEYVGTSGPYTIKAWSYKNLTLNGTATFTEGANTTVATLLTINPSNTYSLAGFNLTGGGTISNTGTLQIQGGETVTMTNDTDSGTTTFNGTGNYTVTPGALPLNSYYHLTFNGSGGQWKLGSALDVNGDLTFTAGSLTGNAQNVALAGSLSASSGTFTFTTSALTLDGTDQTVNATFTVASLTKSSAGGRTLTLGAGKTLTVTGATTLTGTSDVSRLALVSSTPTSAASLDMQGTKTLQYLSVQDSTALTAASCFTGCYDNGRNSGWAFEAAATVTHSGGTTDVTEGGATDSFTIVLSGQPSSDVTVSLTPPADVTLSISTLTFTNADWATPQTVTVTAVDDAVDETSPEAVTISLLTSSSDNTFNGLSGNIAVAVTDNDAVGFTLTQSGGTTDVAEGGATDSYTLVLASQPTADVVVTVAGDADASVSPTTLTFTSANWSTPQEVTVTAVNDSLVEGVHSATITNAVSSADVLYNVLTISNVTVSVTDNDTAGYTVTESGGTTAVTEGGASDTYTVVLTAQPTANVTVTPSGGADLSLSPSSLTFTSVNWATPQTFTVTAVNDALVEGTETPSITHAISSVDADFAGASIANVSVTVTDNDTAGFVLTESGGTTAVTEGGATDSYTLVLTAQPSADVVVTLTVPSDVTVSASTLTFTNANWSTPQTVTVTAVQDTLDEPSPESVTITHTSASADATFNGLSIGGAEVAVTDDDGTPTLAISDVTATETNGTVDVTVTMTGQSQSTVSVAYATSDGTALAGADYESASGTLEWTSGQTGAKTFSVLLNEDALDEDDETVVLTLSDAVNGTVSDADGILNITDNDATPTVAWTLATQTVGEDAGVVAVTAQLSAVSGRDVSVPFALSGTATADDDYTFDPVSPLSIPAGTLTAVLQVTVLDDTNKEQNETVVAAIGTPTNATPGTNDVQTITVADNEPGGGVRVPPPPSLATAISLFTPNGGETYRPGDQVQIVWSVPESRVDFLNYAWSPDDGVTWNEVGTHVSSALPFSWTVPDVSTTTARFRIEADDLATVYASDTSDAPFTILGTVTAAPEASETPAEETPAEPAPGVPVLGLPETAVSQVTGFPEPVTPITWGTFVRSMSLPTGYYLDPVTKTRRAIVSKVILRTYGAKTSDLQFVSDATLQFVPLGLPLPPKAGTVLVKITQDAKVYYLAVPEDKVSDGILRHVVSEYVAGLFFGGGWKKYVIDIPKEFLDILPFGAPLGVGDAIDLDALRTREELSRED